MKEPVFNSSLSRFGFRRQTEISQFLPVDAQHAAELLEILVRCLLRRASFAQIGFLDVQQISRDTIVVPVDMRLRIFIEFMEHSVTQSLHSTRLQKSMPPRNLRVKISHLFTISSDSSSCSVSSEAR